MQFLNIIDERGRFVELKVYDNGLNEQSDSHTYSYLGAREARQEVLKVMGFDKPIETIDDYVTILSPEEVEQHKGLIAECRRRELNIKISCGYKERLLKEHTNSMIKFYQGIVGLKGKAGETLNVLSDASLQLNNHIFNEYCRKKEDNDEKLK